MRAYSRHASAFGLLYTDVNAEMNVLVKDSISLTINSCQDGRKLALVFSSFDGLLPVCWFPILVPCQSLLIIKCFGFILELT